MKPGDTMKRTPLRPKEFAREVEHYQVHIDKKDLIESVEIGNEKIILVNTHPSFFYHHNIPLPLLKYLQHYDVLKKVVVDRGAIKFIVNGADVMRPGIKEIDPDIAKDEPVLIIDAIHKKPLAVGITLVSGSEMQALTTGKVIKTLHYVGDHLWKLEVN